MMAISLATSPYPAAMEGWLPAPEAKEDGTFDHVDAAMTTPELNSIHGTLGIPTKSRPRRNFSTNDPGCRAGAGGGVAGHFGAQAGIGGRVEQRSDSVGLEVRGYPRVAREQIRERPAFDKGGLRGVVDDVMRVLTADLRAEVQHDGLGHDQAAAELKVSAHAPWVELETP